MARSVLEYVRWVMVRKRDEAAPAPGDHVPRLPTVLDPKVLSEACPPIDVSAYDTALSGSPYLYGDYEVGERIDHVDGITVEEAEHMIATRLYQNTARIHFNQYIEGKGPLRPPADLRRPCDFACPRSLLQRLRQRFSSRRHQRRTPRRAAVCRRHRVRLVGGARASRNCRDGMTSARSGFAPSPRATAPAKIIRLSRATSTIRRFCSIWIIGC